MKTKFPQLVITAFVFAMCACNGPNDPANTDSILPSHRDSMPVLKLPLNDTNSAVITPPVNDPNVVNPDTNNRQR